MLNCYYGDFETFLHDNDDRVYRMWEYKKSWTPWEIENRTEFNENFINEQCRFILIRESINLPDGDILLGVQEVNFDENDKLDDYPDEVDLDYYRLSNICLSYSPRDQFRYEENEEE